MDFLLSYINKPVSSTRISKIVSSLICEPAILTHITGQQFPTPKHVTSTSPITSGSGHVNSGSGHMTSGSGHMTSAKVTFDPGRDHMIKRNGTSPSLVQICTLTFRGGSFRYKFPYRPPILLGAKPFTYNKRKTTLTLWYKKNMDACACLARCSTSVIDLC